MKYFTDIAEFGRALMESENIDKTLHLISEKTKSLVSADRCSIFLVDKEEHMLWTGLSDGLGRIVLALDSGIVGETYKEKKPQIVNNPYENIHFLTTIDSKSGYKTESILSIPIFNSKHEVMGIMQLLNKIDGEFNEEDVEKLIFFANYISGSLELIMMNEIGV